jgi:hypothetical protein
MTEIKGFKSNQLIGIISCEFGLLINRNIDSRWRNYYQRIW